MPFTRRQFLRANGATLALPFLHSLATAQEIRANRVAKKLAILYVPNGVVRKCFFPGEQDSDLPDFIGGFDADRIRKQQRVQNVPGIYPLELTQTLQPLVEHSSDVTFITGLDRSYKEGQDVHAQAASCYLTSLSPGQAKDQGIRHPNGRTLDQIIGDVAGRDSIFRTLEISCNGFNAPKEPVEFDNISWYGPNRMAPSIRDPRQLYDRLFMKESDRQHVANVTDLVLEDARNMSRKAGVQDRETIAQFMESVREIENRLDRVSKLLNDTTVQRPAGEVLPRGEYIRLQMELMLLAFQMGITNVCTFMVGPERWDATLMYEGVFDHPVQHHNMTHNQKGDGYKDLQKIDSFHMQQYSWLLKRMKEIRESDGSTLLENSIVTYGAGIGDGATHQYFDLPMIVAGTAQGQIRQGRFLKCRSGTLNSCLWLTIAQLMGLEMKQFADSTQVISDLWT